MKAETFAVAGASNDPSKYGHLCYAALLRHGFKVFPLNPKALAVLGAPAYAKLADLPLRVEALSIVTPPAVTEQLMEEAIAAGVKHVWMQPGAASAKAVARGQAAGMTVISDGPCLLVELAKRR